MLVVVFVMEEVDEEEGTADSVALRVRTCRRIVIG